MKFNDLKKSISDGGYYLNDEGILKVGLATVIANRCKIGGNPVWMTLIGPSSSGKSQLLDPIVMTGRGAFDESTGKRGKDFIVNVDDMTANTLLSGAKGEGYSLLSKDFTLGMFAMTDLTVLISKDPTERGQILAQFRKIYDGGFNKNTGNQKEASEWEGYIGFISGSTPSIYSFLEEVGDMGERFLSYRMRNLDDDAITEMAMFRKVDGKDLDKKMADKFNDYIKSAVSFYTGDNPSDNLVKGEHQLDLINIGDDNVRKIMAVAKFAEKLRTVTKHDFYGNVERIPVVAGSSRTSKQLQSYAHTFAIMKKMEGLEFGDDDLEVIEWIGWSLANEEKREMLRFIAESDTAPSKDALAQEIGIHETVVQRILSNMMALKIIRIANTESREPGYAFYDDEIEARIKKLVGNQSSE
jgi:hypothetical protein